MSSYTIQPHRDTDGSWWADVAELPGCFAAADTREGLLPAISEAIVLYLQDEDETKIRVEPEGSEPFLGDGETPIYAKL